MPRTTQREAAKERLKDVNIRLWKRDSKVCRAVLNVLIFGGFRDIRGRGRAPSRCPVVKQFRAASPWHVPVSTRDYVAQGVGKRCTATGPKTLSCVGLAPKDLSPCHRAIADAFVGRIIVGNSVDNPGHSVD